MENIIDYSDGILNKGNTYRLKELMKKADKGGTYTIGFIGGSITQGAQATDINLCYAYHVYEWWVKMFPESEFIWVNAGIGATDSQFASARVYDDLLSKNPDFVVTEFSVNDENNEHFRETYEGLLRHVYGYKTNPAVIVMNNVFYDKGTNAEDQHLTLAKHYDIPSVGVRTSIYKAITDGKLNVREVTADDLHPNNYGHELVAKQITFFLDSVYKDLNEEEQGMPLGDCLTMNTYEHSKRFNNKNASPCLAGFIKDESKQEGLWDCFKNGWTARKTGDKISFKIQGTNLSVQYKKCHIHPAPVAKLTLDNKQTIILDANFDETWGDKLYLTTIAEHIEDTEHLVEIELIETHENDTAPFYLAAILASGNNL